MSRCHLFPLLLALLLVGCQSTAPAERSPSASSEQPVPAPLLDGLGTHTMPITTDSEQTQRYFNQGLVLAYGFNHAEAARYERLTMMMRAH